MTRALERGCTEYQQRAQALLDQWRGSSSLDLKSCVAEMEWSLPGLHSLFNQQYDKDHPETQAANKIPFAAVLSRRAPPIPEDNRPFDDNEKQLYALWLGALQAKNERSRRDDQEFFAGYGYQV